MVQPIWSGGQAYELFLLLALVLAMFGAILSSLFLNRTGA
jgi:hypothetical protein